MPTQFQQDDQEVEIREYEVLEGPDTRLPELTETRTMTDRSQEKYHRPERKNKYGWAFFLCSMFIGLGFTTVSELAPLPLFLGLGVGFLFFVDPIYNRVMDLFE